MYARFLQYISQNKLIDKKNKPSLLLAVSGGLDSMVLLHLFKRAVDSSALNLDLAIAHCNFSLRGEESGEDAKFVQTAAQKLGLEIFLAKFQTKEYAQKEAISIEMAARDLRYNFFRELMQTKGFDLCALAHHKDDLVETQCINLLRGTGIKGLCGILPKRDEYIRPLLFARRAEIEAYAKANGIEYRTDSTNLTDDYLRNKIRHRLLPLLEELNPRVVNRMAMSSRSFCRSQKVLEDWYLKCEGELVRGGDLAGALAGGLGVAGAAFGGGVGACAGAFGGGVGAFGSAALVGVDAGGVSGEASAAIGVSGVGSGQASAQTSAQTLVQTTEENQNIEVIAKTAIKKFVARGECFEAFFEMYLQRRNFTAEQIEQIISNWNFGEANKVFDDRDGRRSLMRTSKAWFYLVL